MPIQLRDYALEGIGKLRGIAITEVVFGCLAVAKDCSELYHARSDGQLAGGIISLATAVLLLATGSYGIDILKRFRVGESISAGQFRTLAILNMVLCILYIICLVIVVVTVSLLASVVSIFSSGLFVTVFVIIVIGNLVSIGLTFMAFKISRQNSGIIRSGGMIEKGKETAVGYSTPPPAYTQMQTDVPSSEQV